MVSGKDNLRNAPADGCGREALDSKDEAEAGRLAGDTERTPKLPWKKPLALGCAACLLALLAVLCSSGSWTDCLRKIPPQFCALAFFLFSVVLRIVFHYCGRRALQSAVAASCCACMVAASFFLGEYAGHRAPWLLLAGIFCAFIPNFLAALSAVLAMGFGLCLLPGKIIPEYEFRIMLFAFPAAVLAFTGKIPPRFRNPAMMKGLGAACHYIVKGNFPHPDVLVLAGVAVAGLLFWLWRKFEVRGLRAWGFLWGFAMLVVETLLHLDGRTGAIAAACEILCALALLLAWVLGRRRRMGLSKEKKSGTAAASPR